VPLFRRPSKGTKPERQDEDFLLSRAAPAWSHFIGAEIVEQGAILRWRTEYGTVGVAYPVPYANHSARRFVQILHQRYARELPDYYACIVSASLTMGWYGPDLEALDIHKGGEVTEVYRPICEQVARIIGTAVPIWPSPLRDPETIEAWKPGGPPANVPAFYGDLPIEPFLALAADEAEDSFVALVCMWLAQTIRDTATESATRYIEMLQDVCKGNDGKWFTFGAVPAEIRRREAEPLPEVTRRVGWLQILERRDTLAAKVASLVQKWDGGDDWQAGVTAEIHPNECPTAAAWAARLVPAPNDEPPTALEQDLLSSVDTWDAVELLQDPDTQMAAIYYNKGTSKEYIATKVPFRIETHAPLSSVILSDDTVWIVTRDKKLWIAPEYPGFGLNWGYQGSGPHTLAQLLERLLANIVSPAVDAFQPQPRPGLFRLIANTPQDGTTTYTREQLEKARDAPMQPEDEEWLEAD
jgi:hypothetical protein